MAMIKKEKNGLQKYRLTISTINTQTLSKMAKKNKKFHLLQAQLLISPLKIVFKCVVFLNPLNKAGLTVLLQLPINPP